MSTSVDRLDKQAEAAPQDSTEARVSKKKILIADDDDAIRQLLVDVLRNEGYETYECKRGSEVLRTVPRLEPDLMVLDVMMPDNTGIEIMRRLNEQDTRVPTLVMTAHGTSRFAIEATQLGAYDYITKPFDLDEVLHTVRRYFEYEQLSTEVRKLRALEAGRDPADRIIGNSPMMQHIYKEIGKVAASDANVLVMGETGTGKELVGETVHAFSNYRNGPLVKVNLTALPETLVESELFGHEKGSFTGAIAQHKGKFEMAHKGTIFLDEIGDMTLSTQRKLLRVLQDKQFERVGGSTSVKVDCRVVAATNKNLAEEVQSGRFREDLYYRLNVITIHMPPLRERKEDVPLLVEHFLAKFRYQANSPPSRISEEAMQALIEYDWPGNVRQLEHTIERAVIVARSGIVTSQHLNLEAAAELAIVDINQKLQNSQSLPEVVAEVERLMLSRALERTGGNRYHAAKMLGIDIAVLEKKLDDHGVAL
jgi:two-component system, NtrC family, response regulator AtoC